MNYDHIREPYDEVTLENGLKVIFLPKPAYCTSAFLFMTPFGSLDVIQKNAQGETITYEPGTAHFLEHKLFESDAEDVMRKFSRLGANVNAYTSYDSTAYYFTTTSQDVLTPLTLLLDFVQHFSITEASVEKEKPIILEELAMYQQDPDARLFLESMRAVYSFHPLGSDIVGDESSIRAITLSHLEEAYRRNYHPSTMTLIAVTSAPKEEVLECIRANQAAKHRSSGERLVRWFREEPPHPAHTMVRIPMELAQPKTSVTIRLPIPQGSLKECLRMEWALRLGLETVFTPIHPLYQSWIDEGRITAYFSYEADCTPDYAFLYFEDAQSDAEKLKQFVMEQLDGLCEEGVKEADLEQLKRRVIGAVVRSSEHPSDLISTWARAQIRGVTPYEECDLVHELTAEDCTILIRSLDRSCISCVTLVQEGENA
ncbi:MAG: insulinase family protein [Solobacterium sp.]|nr:insulinase family protein [Solobacterium sp.]